ncbi:MAG TPA: DUF4397 domain-containing protein [Thermomicrobiales bacterium]|nr:DUF4397 domain-containing protein [Thermomicrobiales bacterium]
MKRWAESGRHGPGASHRRRQSVTGVLAGLILILGALSGSVAGGAGAQETGQALVRFVHVSPDAPPFDIYVDGQIVVKGVKFPTATDFLPFPGGEHHIQFAPAGSTVEGALIDIDQNLDEDTSYEIVAMGLLNDVEGDVFEVDTSMIQAPGLARVRLIQAAPLLGSVDVVIEGGDKLFEDVEFPEATDYRDVTAATINLTLNTTNESVTLARLDELAIEAGWVYDIFAAGQQQNETLQFLALKAPATATCSSILGIGGPEDGCVRFVHASPDTPALAVYVDDASDPISPRVSFGEATGFIALPEGEHRIRLVPEGVAPDGTVVEAAFEVEPRSAVELVAMNTRESIEIRPYPMNLEPLPVGQARVRVIHTVPDADPIDAILADGSTLVGGVGFSDEAAYAAFPSGSVSFELTVSGEDDVLLPASRLTFEPGMVYDVLVTGLVDQQGLQLVVLSAPSVSAREREGIQPAGGDGAPPVASPEIVPTTTPTPVP